MDEFEWRIRAARPFGGEDDAAVADALRQELDELEQRIRATSPAAAHCGQALSDRAKRELDELLVGSGYEPVYFADRSIRSARRRWRRAGPAWLGAAAAVVLIAVTALMFWPGAAQTAHAATPPLLVVEPVSGSGAELLTELAQAVRVSEFAVPVEGEDVTIKVHSWALSMQEIDGEVDPSLTVISPKVHLYTFRRDGSMSQVITSGQGYDETGVPVEQGPAPGTIVGTFEHGPGEHAPLFTESAPRDSGQVEEFLTMGGGLPAVEDASSAFTDVSYLLNEQRLDNHQTAALLEFIATLPDYTVEGTTTDRLGRPALVLSAPRVDREYTDSLLLDPDTGQVLAFEATYTGDTRTDLTAPAVTEYYAWENDA